MNAYNDILPSLNLRLLGFKCHKEQSLDIILCSLLVVVFIVERVLFSFTIEVEGKKNGNSYGMSRHAIFVFTACILGADWNIEPATLRLCGVAKGWGESQKARLGTIRICINSKRELSHSIFVYQFIGFDEKGINRTHFNGLIYFTLLPGHLSIHMTFYDRSAIAK